MGVAVAFMVTDWPHEQVLVRYLARGVLVAVAGVSCLLLGLYSLIELIREVRDLAGDYGLWSMMMYLIQTSPRRLYDIFPFAALIGTLIGIGGLAQHNELVAMRAAGVHRQQISAYALGTVGLCLLLLVASSELLVPSLETTAQAHRDQAISGQITLDGQGAFWVRDGQFMVRIGHSVWGEDQTFQFADMVVYELADDLAPKWKLAATTGAHSEGQWTLREVAITQLSEGTPVTEQHTVWTFPSTLSPELFDAAVTRPRLLSTRDLLGMQAFLRDNALDATPYTQALWQRVFFPVHVLAMVLIGLPFALGGVFRQNPRGGLGLNLFAGIGIGLMYFVMSRLVQGVVGVWSIPIWLGSLLPALIIALVALVLLTRR